MNNLITNTLLALLLPLLIGGSMQIFAKKDIIARLELLQGVDICSNDFSKKQALFGINIGNVEKNDSLFGFNFEVSYDNTKLQFNRPIYFNTLSEAFDELTRDVTVGFEPGTIRGYAVHLNFSLPPVWGNKPLIALLFDYLGNSPDTTSLFINYIEFTKEFKNNIVSYEPCQLKIEFIDKPQRYAEFYFDTDSLIFDNEENNLSSIKIYLKTGSETKIRNLQFDLLLDNPQNYTITKILHNPENIISFEQESADLSIRLKTILSESFSNGEIVEIFIKNNSEIKSEGSLSVNNIEFNPDHCVTRLISSELKIITSIDSTKDTIDTNTTAIYSEYLSDSNINSFYDRINDEFIIESEQDINFASFYDLRGLLLKRVDLRVMTGTNRIKATDLPKGVYFVVVKFKNKETKSLINIKY